jgi:hypothetical protein
MRKDLNNLFPSLDITSVMNTSVMLPKGGIVTYFRCLRAKGAHSIPTPIHVL